MATHSERVFVIIEEKPCTIDHFLTKIMLQCTVYMHDNSVLVNI